jgi:hypothetical protein
MHIQLAAGCLITAETSERRFRTGSLGSEYPFEVADGPPGSWRPTVDTRQVRMSVPQSCLSDDLKVSLG